MKKFIVLLLSILLILSCFTGCKKIDSEASTEKLIGIVNKITSDDGEDSEEEEEELFTSRNICVKTQYSTYGNEKTIYYYLNNTSEDDLYYDDNYYLRYYNEDEEWEEIPISTNTDRTTSHLIPSGMKVPFELDLTKINFEFNPGKYRIIRRLGNYLCYCTFTLGDDDPLSVNKYDSTGIVSKIKNSYSVEDAINDRIVAITPDYNYNTDLIWDFATFSALGFPCKVHIVRYNEDGLRATADITYDGYKYSYKYDNSMNQSLSEYTQIDTTRPYLVSNGTNVYLSDYSSYIEPAEGEENTYVLILAKSESVAVTDITTTLRQLATANDVLNNPIVPEENEPEDILEDTEN